jgi:transcriptional regulator with XRE-family HTH domain
LPAYQRERRQLAETLRLLRAAAGLSGAELASRLGWTQSKISKIETLKQLPSEADITAWVSATNSGDEGMAELQELLRRARVEYASWRDSYRVGGADGVQVDILDMEARSARIAEFQPAWIPGLLQTPAYAREIMHLPCGPLSFGEVEDGIDRMIATRMQRQNALYDPGKQVQVVLLEQALRSRVASVTSLAGQLDRLIGFSGLPALELGIIPFEAPVRVYPLSGFRLYDDIVIIESIVGEQQLGEPEEVARYEHYLELLRETASTGPDAVKIIQRALASLDGQD